MHHHNSLPPLLPPPTSPDQKLPRSLPVEIASTLGAWVTGQIKIVAIMILLYALGFALAGLPWWALIAILCGFLHLVPFVGSVLGLALAELVMYSADGDLYHCLAILAIWVIVEGIEGFWLTPKILGKRLQLSPIAVFFVAIAGGALFGPLGVIFAVPVAAVIAVVYRALLRKRQQQQRQQMAPSVSLPRP